MENNVESLYLLKFDRKLENNCFVSTSVTEAQSEL